MYFDIALTYHATINVAQHEQIQMKNPEQDYDTRPTRLPSQIGSDMLTGKVIATGGNQP